jgi:Protein of unknown function (DUF2786)
MTEQVTPETKRKTADTIQKLILLANDESNEEEARTAAVQACRLMKSEGLQVVSVTDLEEAEKRMREASVVAGRAAASAASERKKNMVMGAALGFAISKYL